MPILKPISGHGSTGGIRRYLEKGGRALARDLFNLSYDERDAGALGEDAKEACAWDAEMDATRAAFGTDAPWRGKPARTFKHFVLSPDPGDDIDLATLRELACSWALRHFDDHEIAIVYHDDNARGIPHAHIVVNNANLRTGYRMQTQHPEDLNRDLQDMARERGLSGLSNDRAPESPSKARGHAGAGGPRSRRSVYLGRAEKEIMRSGGYSWVGDIRARVALAKTTARDEAEFLGILDALGVHVADNSAKARRDDWVFSLAEEPSKKVTGERLGFVYGKEMLRRRFEREGAYRPTDASAARIREAAERALELNDLSELSRLSSALETCAKFDVESIEEFGLRMATLERRGQAGGEGYRRLEAARAYMAENGLMPLKTRYGDDGGRGAAEGSLRDGRRGDEQQRILAAERQRTQQDQRRERGRMMVRIEYEGGRTTLFDTLSFTEGSPFSGANMLTEFELEMREEPEKGLWLTANWHQVRDDWRADAPADGIPAARRSRGWRFMLASEAELGRARRVLLDGDEAFARVRGYLCDAAAIGACYREHVGPPSKPLKSQIRDLQRALGRAEVPGVPDELARLLAQEKEEGADEGARKVKEDWGDVDEEAW